MLQLGGGRVTKESSIDLSVGVVLKKKVGDEVRAGESLATVHASCEEKAGEAAERLLACYSISPESCEKPPFIKAIVR